MAEPKYGNFGGNGSRYKEYPDRPSEAWVLDEARTAWLQINTADHGQDVHEISKEAFEARFPGAPPLPKDAFQPR